MKKILNFSLIIAFGLAIAFTGCKKYDEGPMLSLASKKARVVNTWKIEKLFLNDLDITSTNLTNLSIYSIEFKNDNTFIENGTGYTETGKWDFDSKKENLLCTYNGSITDDKYEILKLKSSEMWLKYTDGAFAYEFHYVTK